MESADVAAAVIGGLLGGVEVHYHQAINCEKGCRILKLQR
jgi:hypothetical protein